MRYFSIIIFYSTVFSMLAFRGPDKPKYVHSKKGLAFKMDCAPATAQTDLNINNVRARLLIGSFGWDGNQAGYVIPNVGPGEPEVSSIFAGALWMGGLDANGNLKLAAQQYGSSSGLSDYWPGPLTETGLTDSESCANWDRFFKVTGADIDLHLAQFQEAQDQNIPYDVDLIPNSIKGWPALGNDFFFEQAGFSLPSATQGLAPFMDVRGTGTYEPEFGDYPIIEMRGCTDPLFADEMVFWIFNDVGNVHSESGGDVLSMEIQAQSLAYATNDEINDMTFSRYKLINRAAESISDTYFGIWIDPDLGCGEDDFVGCDTIRDMMYVYNADAVDGNSGSNCNGFVSTNTYGDNIPYLGVDLLRGPIVPKVFGPNGELMNPGIGEIPDTLVVLGMDSFMYFNRPSDSNDPRISSPNVAPEYYNFLSGVLRNGQPLTIGGFGLGGTVTTKFAFHDEPTSADGWSMCTANLPMADRRSVLASGPFRLDSGQVNEMIIGIPWVPNVTYPCPDMSRLFAADDLAQSLFDNCFDRSDIVSTSTVQNERLNQIEVYPNPSMASSNESVVNITNLPQESVVSIYTLAGQLVRQFKANDSLLLDSDATLQWDLNSAAGTPVASGLYFIHVRSEGVGEKVLKLSVFN